MVATNPRLPLLIISSFVGRAWGALLTFALMPVYIRTLGIEFVGLLGFFAALQPILNLLDMGLSNALNREMARLSASPETRPEQRDLVRTLEILYWGLAFALGCSLTLMAPLAAKFWIQADQLDESTVSVALCLMGLSFAFRFPGSLYQGGLLGLQRHVSMHGILMAVGTLRAVGAAIIIIWVSPTVTAFFLWQLFSSIVQLFALRTHQWALLRHEATPRFRTELLRQIKTFAVGITGISLVTVVLTNVDKILLIRLLGAHEYGYYAVAVSVAGAVSLLFGPLYGAAFPRFSQLIAAKDSDGVLGTYHTLCQFTTVLVAPAVVVLALFSREVLLLWLNDSTLASNCHILVTILVVGTGINGLLNIPYALQLANGWTSLALCQNFISAVIFVPTLAFVAPTYGPVGAALLWLAMNAAWFLVTPHIMHKRLLLRRKWSWYLHDITLPLLAAVMVTIPMRIVMGAGDLSRLSTALVIAASWILATVVVVALAPRVNVYLNAIPRRVWNRV